MQLTMWRQSRLHSLSLEYAPLCRYASPQIIVHLFRDTYMYAYIHNLYFNTKFRVAMLYS